MIKNLIFIGYPGSGKGTVAKLLPEFTQISTGDLLRQEVASGSALGAEIAARINQGQFISDEIAIELIRKNFSSEGKFIFDGFPRTLPQAEKLDTLLDFSTSVAVLFKIDRERLVERIIHRRSCGACGAIYNLQLRPPQQADTCDHCEQVGLKHRSDDKLEVLEARFKLYEDNAPGILDHYRRGNRLVTLDATADTEKLAEKIRELK